MPPLILMLENTAARSSRANVVYKGQYVYCIIGTGEARNFGPIGIGDRGDPVTTITCRDLGAVVSSVPMTKYVVSKETMISHEKVIEAVMKDHTLLPVRYYTIATNAEEIRSLLRRRYLEFRKLLRELDNKVELGLKAFWRDMNSISQELASESGEKKKLGVRLTNCSTRETDHDKSTLGEMFKLALENKRAKEKEALLQPLRHLSSDSCLNTTYGDDMLMNATFLVDRTREKEFDREVEELTARYKDRIEFKYVGPAPPYSFVNIVVKE